MLLPIFVWRTDPGRVLAVAAHTAPADLRQGGRLRNLGVDQPGPGGAADHYWIVVLMPVMSG
jgi:hypothetical protein